MNRIVRKRRIGPCGPPNFPKWIYLRWPIEGSCLCETTRLVRVIILESQTGKQQHSYKQKRVRTKLHCACWLSSCALMVYLYSDGVALIHLVIQLSLVSLSLSQFESQLFELKMSVTESTRERERGNPQLARADGEH